MNTVNLKTYSITEADVTLSSFTASFIEYMGICWPTFVKRKDCVVLNDVSIRDLADLLHLTQHSRASVETQLNRRRLIHMLPISGPISPVELTVIGTAIKQMWQAKLQNDFPDRTFSVIFTEGKTGLDVENFEITFFQNNFSRQ